MDPPESKGFREMKRKRHLSNETRLRRSEAYKGKKRRPFTVEHRQRISESRKGMKFSEELKRKLSESHKGKHPTMDQRVKLSQSSLRWWGTQSRSVRKLRMQKASQARWPRWTDKQEREFRERNPYSSEMNPREYSAWYHKHHPGYFAEKTREWIRRQPKRRQQALYAKSNERNRTYVTAYCKLRRRLDGLAKARPSFSTEEKVVIDNSAYLTELLQKLRTQFPQWFL